MPKISKYGSNTPFSTFVNAYPTKENVCSAAQKWNSRYLMKTLGEMANDDDLKSVDYDPSWGIWLLYKFGEDIDVHIRKKLISAIRDSMQAFSVYLTFVWLSDEEDELLEEKFKGKLPTAEKELVDGVVTRAKWQ
jgi:hypothetical protein